MSINSKTKLCCIIGNPVEHSLSPIMHNAGYKALDLNFVFVAFRVSDVKHAMEGLRALNVRGIVVTVPHKLEVMKYVDEIDDVARKIGAVNTIVNDNGVLRAINTDWIGGIGPLKQVLASQGEALRGKKVALLGAGGGARALAFGLKREGAEVLIFNRTVSHGKKIMQDLALDGVFGLGQKENIRKTDIIVNTTSLGMEPNVDSCAIDASCIKPNHIVYDIVYTPKETKLLRIAKNKGATIVYGDKMVLYGGIPQFELFTGVKAPVEIMEEVLLKGLTKYE